MGIPSGAAPSKNVSFSSFSSSSSSFFCVIPSYITGVFVVTGCYDDYDDYVDEEE